MAIWLRYRASLETNCLILAAIAEKGEFAQYELPRAVGKDYRTILRHLIALENTNLIRLVRTEPAKKGGKERKIYSLTIRGLVALLRLFFKIVENEQEIVKAIDEIAPLYHDSFPLIFGKWNFWEKHSLKSTIVKRLRKTLLDMHDPLLPLMLSTPVFEEKRMTNSEMLSFITIIKGAKTARKNLENLRFAQKQIDSSINELTRQHINRMVLFALPCDTSKDFLSFLKVLSMDEDLRFFVDSRLLEAEKEYETFLRNIQSWKEFWQQITRNNSIKNTSTIV